MNTQLHCRAQILDRNEKQSDTARPAKARSYRYSTHFEVVACNRQGAKINGKSYRQGRKPAGHARCYQSANGPDDDGQIHDVDPRLHDSPLCALVRERLRQLLCEEDFDVLYLHHVAGWSQVDVAKKLGVHRSTIKRRLVRICQTILADEVLQQAVGPTQHEPLFMGRANS